MIYKYIIASIILLIAWQGLQAQGCEEPDTTSGSNPNRPQIIGFVQPQYEFHFTDNGDVADNSNTFKFKRARIGVTGRIPYDFAYYVMLENSSFVSQTGNPYLLDAFISYRRYKWANISVGSFKQPFGQEVNTSCSGLHTIERAGVSDQIVAPQRDMGIMILGGDNNTFMKYSVAIMNGSGLGTKDNNNMKDFIGRATFKPLDFLRIGGSFRYGFPNKDTLDRTSVAAEIQFNYANFLLQAEYIYDEGDYNRAAGGGCGAEPLVLGNYRSGYYVMAKYRTYFMLEPVAKFEYFNTGNEEGYADYITTLGINYFFNDKVRLQANYRYRAEKNNESNAEIPNDAFLVQLQVKF